MSVHRYVRPKILCVQVLHSLMDSVHTHTQSPTWHEDDSIDWFLQSCEFYMSYGTLSLFYYIAYRGKILFAQFVLHPLMNFVHTHTIGFCDGARFTWVMGLYLDIHVIDLFMSRDENMLQRTHQWNSQQQKGLTLYRIKSLITFTQFIIINIPSGDARLFMLCYKSFLCTFLYIGIYCYKSGNYDFC